MNRVKSFEEFLRTDSEGFDYNNFLKEVDGFKKSIKDDLNINLDDVSILPIFEDQMLSSGILFSYVKKELADEDMSEKYFNLSFPMLGNINVVEIEHSDGYSAEKMYEKHVSSNYYIRKCNKPKELKLGWQVFKGNGIEWHTVRLVEIKKLNLK